MAWDIETIKDAVEETESNRADLVRQMDVYERAWRLDFWGADDYEAANAEGRRLFTAPDPRNIVSVVTSLLEGDVRVSCPTQAETEQSALDAAARGRFLETLIDRQSRAQEMSVIDALGWFAAVRGRMAMQVAWVFDILPASQRIFTPPIIYRVLDPKGVGVQRDTLGVQWAYHKYKQKLQSAKARYPQAFDTGMETTLPSRSKPEDKTEVTITDFWYAEKGVIYNAVLIDNDKFAKKPKRSRLPLIPIIERNSEPTPAPKERWRSASVLEGTLESWGELNFVHSMHLTAVGKYFWPTLFLTADPSEPIDDIDTGMGAVNVLPPETKFINPNDKPDINLLSTATQVFNGYVEQSSFPASLYGDPGNMRAAYGQQLNASTALRRISPLKRQMELLLEEANEISLWMVKTFAPQGVELVGYDQTRKQPYTAALTAEQIEGALDNTVSVEVSLPGTQMQDLMLAIQLSNSDILSKQTVRENWVPRDKKTPDDEATRILIQKVMEDPDLLRERLRRAFSDYYGYQLPAGEPDFAKTAQQQQQRPPQIQGPPPQMPPPQMPMPGQGPPPGMPMAGATEFQGGLSPDMMGMPQGAPDTQALMAMMQGQPPGPQDMLRMQQNQYRRR